MRNISNKKSVLHKKVSTSTLVELAEVVLKNNVFTFGKKTLKQIRQTPIGTKFAPPYSILFMAELEEEILREVELKPYLWWRYTDKIFFIWEHGEEKLKEFIDVLNKKHHTIKFTTEWSKTQINFLDVIVCLENGKIKTDLMLSLQILINIFILLHVTPIIVKREFLIVKRSALIGFAQILDLLIGDVMTWKDGY